MSEDEGRSDLRIVKTTKVLNAAMFTLLERSNLGKITVRDLCEEAQISRATFYARFADKYDFLKSWLINLKPEGLDIEYYEKTQALLNDFIYKNKTVIRNLICDADIETVDILSNFIISAYIMPGEYDASKMNLDQIVLCNFYTGGIIHYFQWLARKKFPPEIDPINTHLLEIVKTFMEWIRGVV